MTSKSKCEQRSPRAVRTLEHSRRLATPVLPLATPARPLRPTAVEARGNPRQRASAAARRATRGRTAACPRRSALIARQIITRPFAPRAPALDAATSPRARCASLIRILGDSLAHQLSRPRAPLPRWPVSRARPLDHMLSPTVGSRIHRHCRRRLRRHLRHRRPLRLTRMPRRRLTPLPPVRPPRNRTQPQPSRHTQILSEPLAGLA
jgi:hypothetical protein